MARVGGRQDGALQSQCFAQIRRHLRFLAVPVRNPRCRSAHRRSLVGSVEQGRTRQLKSELCLSSPVTFKLHRHLVAEFGSSWPDHFLLPYLALQLPDSTSTRNNQIERVDPPKTRPQRTPRSSHIPYYDRNPRAPGFFPSFNPPGLSDLPLSTFPPTSPRREKQLPEAQSDAAACAMTVR